MSDKLRAATAAARYLSTTITSIRALHAEGVGEQAIQNQLDELGQQFREKTEAIRAAKTELQLTRTCPVKLGDISAPTAHEVAIKMVFALTQQAFRAGVCFRDPNSEATVDLKVEILGTKPVEVWPDLDALIAEIELEHTRALARLVELHATPIRVASEQHGVSSASAQPLPNSPASELPWEGGRGWEPPTQTQTRRILQYMWNRKEACWEELAEYLWGSTDVKESRMRGALNKANHYLEKNKHHQHLSKVPGEPLIRWA